MAAAIYSIPTQSCLAVLMKCRKRRSVFLIEVVLILTIHDSLLINIITLIQPIESLKAWQTGG